MNKCLDPRVRQNYSSPSFTFHLTRPLQGFDVHRLFTVATTLQLGHQRVAAVKLNLKACESEGDSVAV